MASGSSTHLAVTTATGSSSTTIASSTDGTTICSSACASVAVQQSWG